MATLAGLDRNTANPDFLIAREVWTFTDAITSFTVPCLLKRWQVDGLMDTRSWCNRPFPFANVVGLPIKTQVVTLTTSLKFAYPRKREHPGMHGSAP